MLLREEVTLLSKIRNPYLISFYGCVGCGPPAQWTATERLNPAMKCDGFPCCVSRQPSSVHTM